VTASQPEGPPEAAAGFVREARASDAAELARIQVASWRATLGGLVPAEVLAELSGEASIGQFTERWRDSIASPPTSRHKVLVAYLPGAGDLAGFASIGPATDEDRWPGTDGELYEFHLLPSRTGEGHGGRLLHAVADTLAEDGFQTACTWVLAEDFARADFLKAAGWAPDGSQGNLDMGEKVPVLRFHTLIAGGTTPPKAPRLRGRPPLDPLPRGTRTTRGPWASRLPG